MKTLNQIIQGKAPPPLLSNLRISDSTMTVGHQQKNENRAPTQRKFSCQLYMLFSLLYQRPRFLVYPFPRRYTAVLKTLVRELHRRILIYMQLPISKRAPSRVVRCYPLSTPHYLTGRQ